MGKTEEEKEAARISGAPKTKNKPEGSISGVGKELVKVLQGIMDTLKEKDEEGRRKGLSKRC